MEEPIQLGRPPPTVGVAEHILKTEINHQFGHKKIIEPTWKYAKASLSVFSTASVFLRYPTSFMLRNSVIPELITHLII